jgi:hypothetical protein
MLTGTANTPKRRYNTNVFLAYLALDDNVKAKIEPILYEIHTVASNIGTGENIHRLLQQEGVTLPPDMVEQTIQNQTLWVYLYAKNVWDRISRFAYADKVANSLWFSTGIEPDATTADSETKRILTRHFSRMRSGTLNKRDGVENMHRRSIFCET